MGLFDRLTISDKFNIKLNSSDLKTIETYAKSDKWLKDFQTKDLENWMQDFSIDGKGKLWIHEDHKDMRKRKRYKHHGIVNAYTYITSDEHEHDLYIDLEFKLNAGVAKTVKSIVEKRSNATRISNQKIFEQNRKKWDAIRSTKRFRIYNLLYKRPVSYILNIVSKVTYKISTGCQRLKLKLFWW